MLNIFILAHRLGVFQCERIMTAILDFLLNESIQSGIELYIGGNRVGATADPVTAISHLKTVGAIRVRRQDKDLHIRHRGSSAEALMFSNGKPTSQMLTY